MAFSFGQVIQKIEKTPSPLCFNPVDLGWWIWRQNYHCKRICYYLFRRLQFIDWIEIGLVLLLCINIQNYVSKFGKFYDRRLGRLKKQQYVFIHFTSSDFEKVSSHIRRCWASKSLETGFKFKHEYPTKTDVDSLSKFKNSKELIVYAVDVVT